MIACNPIMQNHMRANIMILSMCTLWTALLVLFFFFF